MTRKAQAITVSCVQHKLHYKKVVRQIEDPSDPITSVPSKPTTLQANNYIGSNDTDTFGFGWHFSNIPLAYLPVLTTTDSLQSTQVIGTTTIPQIKQTAVTDTNVESASRLTAVPEIASLASMSGKEITYETTSLADTYLQWPWKYPI